MKGCVQHAGKRFLGTKTAARTMSKPLDYNARKAAQAVAYFLSKSDKKRLNVVKVVKLVYLADRESIERYGFPILDEDRVSMRLGPVNSTTYSFINGEMEDSAWSEYLRDRSNHQISLRHSVQEDELDELSEADLACLDATWKKFGSMDQWELVNWTHDPDNVPEWEDPDGSSLLIPMSRILKMVKCESADEQSKVISEHRTISKMLARLRG